MIRSPRSIRIRRTNATAKGPLIELLCDSRRLPLLLDEPKVRVFLKDDLHVVGEVARRNRKSVRSRTGFLPLRGRESEANEAVDIGAFAPKPSARQTLRHPSSLALVQVPKPCLVVREALLAGAGVWLRSVQGDNNTRGQ